MHQIGSRFEEQTTLVVQCGITEVLIDSESTFSLIKERVWKSANDEILILISQQPLNKDAPG